MIPAKQLKALITHWRNKMAAFDWNGDGRIDIYDDMLELHNARQSMKNETSSSFGKDKKTPATYNSNFQLSGLTFAAAIILGLLTTGYVTAEMNKPSGFAVVFLFVLFSFILLIVCGAIQAVIEGIIEGFRKK